MKGAMVFGLILGLMWPLIKIVIYGVSARYLTTAPVVNYFAAMAEFGKPKMEMS